MGFERFVQQNLGAFPQFLIFAFLEWVMITWLYINGFIAFLSSEFAKFFDLKTPCLFCTRIDHFFVKRDHDYYYNESICDVHKKNISSLAYCHVHRKLSDIKNMCEGCLLSFASEKDSGIDNYKSLVGILHKDVDGFADDEHKILLKASDGVPVDKGMSFNRCSCCGEPLKTRNSKRNAKNPLLKATLLSNASTSSPRTVIRALRNDETRGVELPHIQYTELKLMPDADSELQEDEIAVHAEVKEDVKAAKVQSLQDPEDMNEDACRTPSFFKANKFFGIPLTDAVSAAASPRWANRLVRKTQLEKELFAETNEANEVRMDRKSLLELYMELDEERSASAVAANNAMAMITRLQAEKAAMQMEALQYQRMMDEQAQYDQEAIQFMKDEVAKRDDKIKAYREKYGPLNEEYSDDDEFDADEEYMELNSQYDSPFGEKSESGSPKEVDHYVENEYISTEQLRDNGPRTTDES